MDLVMRHCNTVAAGQKKKHNNALLHWNSSVGHGPGGCLCNHGNNLIHSFLFHFSVSVFPHPGHTSEQPLSVVTLDLRSAYLDIEGTLLSSLTNLGEWALWGFLFFKCHAGALGDKRPIKKQKGRTCSAPGCGRRKGPPNSGTPFSMPYLLFHKTLGEDLLSSLLQNCALFGPWIFFLPRSPHLRETRG